MTRQTPIRSVRRHGRMNCSGFCAETGAAVRQASASAAPIPAARLPRISPACLGEELGADQDLARLGPLSLADDPILLHHVDEAGRLRVAQAHAPLQERDGRLPLADDEPHAVPVEVVALGAALAPL